jgi:hypothetical protein
VASSSARAPPAAAALVGALSSTGDDLKRPSTCARPPLVAAVARGCEASRQRWVVEEAGEALRELKEKAAAWSAWVEEGGNGGGARICCCQWTREETEMGRA